MNAGGISKWKINIKWHKFDVEMENEKIQEDLEKCVKVSSEKFAFRFHFLRI